MTRRLRHDPALAAAVLLIVAGLAWRAWTASGGWLVISDDVVLGIRALQSGLTPHYLATPYNDHVMPGGLLAYWLLTRWFGLAYWPYLVLIMIGHAVASVLFLRLLRRLLGTGFVSLLPLALFQFTPVRLDATSCVSTALMMVPMEVAAVWALLAQVGYVTTRRRRHLASLAGALAFGLFFFEKSLIIVPLVLLFTTCLYASGGPLRSLGQSLRMQREAWVVLGAVTAVYLALYLVAGGGSGLRRSSVADAAGFLANFFGRMLVPGLAGGPIDWLASHQGVAAAAPPTWLVVAGWLVVSAVVAFTIARRPAAVRAWTLAVAYAVLAVAPLLATRLDGTSLADMYGLMPRFASDPALVFALCVGVAFAGMPGDPPPRPLPRWLRSAPVVALGGVTAVAVTAASAVSGIAYARAWSDNRGRDFVRTAQAEVAAMPPGTVYLDRLLPLDLMWWMNSRYERSQSTLFGADVGPAPTFVTEGEDVFVIDDDGHVRPAWVTGRSALPGPASCGWSVAGSPVSIPLDGSLAEGDWVVRVAYESSADTTATLRIGGASRDFPVRRGSHQYFLSIDSGGDHVDLAVRDPAALCATALTLGEVVGRR